ncbi:MAG TPA: (d)CMP kinase [Gammaproteobacteria bacterium]|nr:(d)CMP kinase [Gammaproteobacteria bacterium]
MLESDIPVFAIDGPSGSGKGTVSRILAKRLGWHYLDSGALYRLTAYEAEKQAVVLSDEAAVAKIAGSLDVHFSADAEGVFLAGENVNDAIRTEACGNRASKVASLPAVRDALLDWQRAFKKPPGLVADGRDMGSVVFPQAKVKVFLTASVEIRAERRYAQLKAKGIGGNLDAIFNDIRERDLRDSARSVAPMKPAKGAVLLDTDKLSIETVVEKLMNLLPDSTV